MSTQANEEAFWRGRWQAHQIGFHEGAPNAHLTRHVSVFSPGQRVLVPLCGKSVDLRFLAERGHAVVGCELVEQAVTELFDEAGVTPTITRSGPFEVREAAIGAGSVRVLIGDALALATEHTGPIDAVFDRAALIALPKELRDRYAARVSGLLAGGSPILLVTIEHDAGSGPPHSVVRAEVDALYGARADVELLDDVDILEGAPHIVAKGATFVREKVYRIVARP